MRRGTTDVAMSRNGKRLLAVFFALFIVFLYLPTVLLLLFSFNNSTVIAFPITDLTTGFYEAAWQDDEIRKSLIASLKVAAGTAVVATALGVLVSYALARRSVRFKAGISAIVLLPLVVPTVVLGVSLLVLFRPQDPVIAIPLGLWAVLIGHVVIALPFCVLLLLPRIARIDKRLEEAAYDLGASGPTTFRRIILPLITPAVIASLLVAFVVSIDEVVIASFLVQDQATYPVYLYSGLRLGGRVSLLMPVATVMIVVSFVLVLAAELIRRYGERRVGLAQ
jgi:spermidine/putrescine transport system permease protein